jgi:hypothetical protein
MADLIKGGELLDLSGKAFRVFGHGILDEEEIDKFDGLIIFSKYLHFCQDLK